MMFLAMMMTIAISANAMTYNTARSEALFLSDKMAYELGLSEDQYEAVYEINLDYLLNMNTRADLFGPWWDVRNRDLRLVLSTWQFDRYLACNHFYRPLAYRAGGWAFPIYNRYNRGRMFYSHPVVYKRYYGGHNHRRASFYAGRHFNMPAYRPNGHHPSMHGRNHHNGHGHGNYNHHGNRYNRNYR